jgi:hypothetical protein
MVIIAVPPSVVAIATKGALSLPSLLALMPLPCLMLEPCLLPRIRLLLCVNLRLSLPLTAEAFVIITAIIVVHRIPATKLYADNNLRLSLCGSRQRNRASQQTNRHSLCQHRFYACDLHNDLLATPH